MSTDSTLHPLAQEWVIGTLLPPFGVAGAFLLVGVGSLTTGETSSCLSVTTTPIGATGTHLAATPVGGQTTTAMHCTSSGGSSTLGQIIFVVVFVILAVASIITPIYLPAAQTDW